MRRERRFSVIIPTLQKSRQLNDLVALYSTHDRVGEILIINNADAPLQMDHPKVRILDQVKNIFVNPAWNLGASEAREDLLLISNDDILLQPELLDALHRVLVLPVGIIGPHPSTFEVPPTQRLRRFQPARHRTYGFGTLMAMKTENYHPIPSELLINCGDDWLFGQQTKLNLTFKGYGLETQMSTTSGRSEFKSVSDQDVATFKTVHANDTPYYASFRTARQAIRIIRRGLRIRS